MIDIILKSISFAFMLASFSFFYNSCLYDGHILGWFRRFLELRVNEFFAKPLGLCIFCFNMQVGFWASVALVWCGELQYNEALAGAIVSNVILKHLITYYD